MHIELLKQSSHSVRNLDVFLGINALVIPDSETTLFGAQIVERTFGEKFKIDELSDWQTNMAIVVINPSKRRMHPNPSSKESTNDVHPFSTEDWDK